MTHSKLSAKLFTPSIGLSDLSFERPRFSVIIIEVYVPEIDFTSFARGPDRLQNNCSRSSHSLCRILPIEKMYFYSKIKCTPVFAPLNSFRRGDFPLFLRRSQPDLSLKFSRSLQPALKIDAEACSRVAFKQPTFRTTIYISSFSCFHFLPTVLSYLPVRIYTSS